MEENKRSNPFMDCGKAWVTDLVVVGWIDNNVVVVDKNRGQTYVVENSDTFRLVPVKLKVVEE